MAKSILIRIGLFIVITIIGLEFFGESNYMGNRVTALYILIPIALITIPAYFTEKKSKFNKLKFIKNYEDNNVTDTIKSNSSNNESLEELKIEIIKEIGESTYYRMSDYARILIKQGDDKEKIKSELMKYGLNQTNTETLIEIIYLGSK